MNLKEIREQIDHLDDQIIPLLHQRLEWVCALKDLKTCLTDPEREREILSKIESAPVREIYLSIFRIFKEELIKRGFKGE